VTREHDGLGFEMLAPLHPQGMAEICAGGHSVLTIWCRLVPANRAGFALPTSNLLYGDCAQGPCQSTRLQGP
jgi:hypothetical protein